MPIDRPDREPSLTSLVTAARDGDEDAWRALRDRVKNVAWKTIRSFSLGRDDAEDAFAATFFRLAEKLHTVREPEAIHGWVATTARHEVLAIIRSRSRFDPYVQVPEQSTVDHTDDDLIDQERRSAMYTALTMISERCQQLLRLFAMDPPLSYGDISRLTGMPHGSIGPTRERCIEQLRRQAPLRPYIPGASS